MTETLLEILRCLIDYGSQYSFPPFVPLHPRIFREVNLVRHKWGALVYSKQNNTGTMYVRFENVEQCKLAFRMFKWKNENRPVIGSRGRPPMQIVADRSRRIMLIRPGVDVVRGEQDSWGTKCGEDVWKGPFQNLPFNSSYPRESYNDIIVGYRDRLALVPDSGDYTDYGKGYDDNYQHLCNSKRLTDYETDVLKCQTWGVLEYNQEFQRQTVAEGTGEEVHPPNRS